MKHEKKWKKKRKCGDLAFQKGVLVVVLIFSYDWSAL